MGVESCNDRIIKMTPSKDAEIATSVKRSLFGRVDHQEVMAFFEEQLAKMDEDNMRRWNFDFVNEQPIRGSFSWEKVASPNVLRDTTSTSNNVTKSKIYKSSTITSHWAKCKKIDRRTAFTKNLATSRKLVQKAKVERIK